MQTDEKPQQFKELNAEGFPEGPCTQQLGTWDLGNSNYSIGLG